LRNERQLAGWHELQFDGAHLPGGIYFYQVSGANFSATGKAFTEMKRGIFIKIFAILIVFGFGEELQPAPNCRRLFFWKIARRKRRKNHFGWKYPLSV
jgi:hypothetical protein